MPTAPRVLLALASTVVAGSLLAIVAAGPGYGAGVLSLPGSFRLVTVGVAGSILGALLALTALRWRRMLTPSARVAVGVILAGALVAAAVPAGWARTGRTVPPIHDISTDTDDPPLFVDVLAVRRGAMNPPEYDGPAVAAQQRAAWPDLGPLDTHVDRARAHAAVRAAMTRAGWAIVGDNEAEGRLEAVVTTRWFRFKDDVVVRLRPSDGGTRIDMRSKSRIGRSDLGTNARRIRAFLDELRTTFEAAR